MDQWADGLKWVVGTAIAIFTGFGIDKWAQKRQQRKYDKKDQREALYDANQGKAIDADQAAFKLVADRLKVVEDRLDKIQAELTSHMADNAKLRTENEWFKKDGERKDREIEKLEKEITALREHRRDSDKTIATLRRELDVLTALVKANGLTMEHHHPDDDPLKVRLVDATGQDRDT